MSESKDTEIRSKYDDLTAEELTEELRTSFFCSSQISGKDVTDIEQMIDVLQKKNPLPDVYSGRELWERFLEVHGEEVSSLGIRNTEEVEEKEPEAAPATVVPVAVPVKATAEPAPAPKRGFRKLLHTALIAAAVVAAMVIITVSASAVGVNIWGWVMVRGEGTVQFVAEDALSKDIPASLKQAGVEVPLFPTWLPEGFLLHDQQIKLDESLRINSTYVYKDQTIEIYIVSMDSNLKSSIIEIEDESSQEYVSGGIIHYIIPNSKQIVAFWLNNGYLVKISGDIGIGEIEHIIDSIYVEV